MYFPNVNFMINSIKLLKSYKQDSLGQIYSDPKTLNASLYSNLIGDYLWDPHFDSIRNQVGLGVIRE